MSIALLFSILTVLALIIPQMNPVVGGNMSLALIFAIITVICLIIGR